MFVAISLLSCDAHMKTRQAVTTCRLIALLVNSLFIGFLPPATAFQKASFDVLLDGRGRLDTQQRPSATL